MPSAEISSPLVPPSAFPPRAASTVVDKCVHNYPPARLKSMISLRFRQFRLAVYIGPHAPPEAGFLG